MRKILYIIPLLFIAYFSEGQTTPTNGINHSGSLNIKPNDLRWTNPSLNKYKKYRLGTNVTTGEPAYYLESLRDTITLVASSMIHDSLGTFDLSLYATKANPTFTGTVTIPTPFTLGATSVTTNGTRLNYLTSATGTTGTTSTNLVFSTSPTLVTPILGAATATSINGLGITTSTGTLTIANGKTATISNTLTFTGTDGSSLNIGTGGTLGTAAYTNATAYEVPLTFSTGLTRTVNTITVNTSQNITKLSNLTGNGFVKTSGGDGTLSIDNNTYLTSSTGVSSITGTSNQITASASVGAVTLSLPNDVTINTSLRTGTLNVTSTSVFGNNITANSLIYAQSGYQVGNTAQVFYSNGTNYSLGTSRSNSNLTITNGSSTNYWLIGADGIQAGTDNTYDLGASGATRPRTGYFGTSLYSPIIYGSTSTTGTLQLRSSSGSATTNSDVIIGDNDSDWIRFFNSGNISIGSTTSISKLAIPIAPTASANIGTVSIGSGGFSGSAGHFAGSASGTSIAVNEASGYAGNLLGIQVNGSNYVALNANGSWYYGGASNSTPQMFTFTTSQSTPNQTGTNLAWYSNTTTQTTSAGAFAYGGGNFTHTSGTQIFHRTTHSFAPTSGTATYIATLINPTINQTGGANGITRGLYISPTITAAADFRAFEVAAGRSVFLGRLQAGKGANVSSANDLTLGADGNVFHITGATTINAITTTNWQAGSDITLIFDSTPTVKNNTAGGANTAIILLEGGVDFSATANDVLKLVYDGTSWFEVSRAIN